MTTQAETFLKFAQLQIAAEALYDQKNSGPGATFSGEISVDVLTLGNERSSRFTQTEAEPFVRKWNVVEHISNTPTGFSGTLFRNAGTGELVLSFRSTEFADDAVRDNQATNAMEIRAEGWAFGQIADMQEWFASLQSSGKLDTARPITLTGYSLGGHLATAFNLLHQNDRTTTGESLIAATYTFNGAGVGVIRNGMTLAQVVEGFVAHRALGANADLFTDAAVRHRYEQLMLGFGEGQPVRFAQVVEAIDALSELIDSKDHELNFAGAAQARQLHDAMERVRQVVGEAERVNAGIASGTDANAALRVDIRNIAGAGLDYQLAVMRAGENTDSFRTFASLGGLAACLGHNANRCSGLRRLCLTRAHRARLVRRGVTHA